MSSDGVASLPAPGAATTTRWGKRAVIGGLLVIFLPFLAFTDIGTGVGAVNQTCQSAIVSSTVQIPSNFTPSALPAGALTLLVPAQQTFASVLSGATGLDAGVVSAWMLNEESGGAALARQAANDNDWLNIGYTDSATYGAADSIWSDPTAAGVATAQWLAGKPSVLGYGTSSEGIRAILNTAGSSPQAQIQAIQTSGWASGGETALPTLYSEITGSTSTTLLTSAPVSSTGAAQGASSSTSAADTYIQGLPNAGQVSYAIVSASGTVIAQHNATHHVSGASITKAMLLVAYLDKLGTHPIPSAARPQLQAMIEDSSNTDANWVFSKVGAAALKALASKAGMTGFRLDTTDPGYTLGLSSIDALDFARFFAQINTLMPATHRAYGMGLLASISSSDSWGILQAGISSVTASKAGWDNWGQSAWTVNQAAQIVSGGQTDGLAITTAGDASLAAGERVLQNLSSAAMNTNLGIENEAAAAACGELPTNQPLQLTQGGTATILPDGQATAPTNAPAPVKALIAAGNQIVGTAYLYGGAHGTPLSEIQSAYDCSSSTSYALHTAGIFKPNYAYVSGQYETWGKPGPGRWVSIFANSGHVFMEVAGIVFDTSWVTSYPPQDFQVEPSSPSSGPRWQPAQAVADEYAVNPGRFVQRHPAGL
jgi:hypothetical protein